MDKSGNELKFGFVGMRVIKTVLSVFICFIIAYLRNSSPVYSTIAAIISTKSDHKLGLQEGKKRIKGTLIGGLFGLICLLLVDFLGLETSSFLEYFIFSLFLIPIIYGNLKIHSSESVSLSCIVFISIVASDSNIAAMTRVLDRTLETFIGIIVSVFVNMIL